MSQVVYHFVQTISNERRSEMALFSIPPVRFESVDYGVFTKRVDLSIYITDLNCEPEGQNVH